MSNTGVTAGDCRRAAALIVSHSRGDLEGVNAILCEANEAARVGTLIVGLLEVMAATMPVIYTQLGQAAMSQAVLTLAQREASDE